MVIASNVDRDQRVLWTIHNSFQQRKGLCRGYGYAKVGHEGLYCTMMNLIFERINKLSDSIRKMSLAFKKIRTNHDNL